MEVFNSFFLQFFFLSLALSNNNEPTYSVSQVLDSLSNPSLLVTAPSGAEEEDEVDLSNMTVQCAVPVYIIQVGSDHTLVRSLLKLQ